VRASSVRDANGQALSYVYYENEPGRRTAADLLTRDEARRIAINIAKMPEFEVSAMRNSLTVTIIAIAMLASQLAYGQAAKPSGPAVGTGDSSLIPPKQPALAPPSNTLSDLAGGGYADPNYVPPKTQSKKSTHHRVSRVPRAWASRRFEQYSNPGFLPYRYCCYWYGYYY
jgi:hypothetical protein